MALYQSKFVITRYDRWGGCAGMVDYSRRMIEAILSGATANQSQARRQATATAAVSANTWLARRLPLGYWNAVSIELSSEL